MQRWQWGVRVESDHRLDWDTWGMSGHSSLSDKFQNFQLSKLKKSEHKKANKYQSYWQWFMCLLLPLWALLFRRWDHIMFVCSSVRLSVRSFDVFARGGANFPMLVYGDVPFFRVPIWDLPPDLWVSFMELPSTIFRIYGHTFEKLASLIFHSHWYKNIRLYTWIEIRQNIV